MKGSPGVTVSLAQTGCHPRHAVVERVLDCSQSPEPFSQVRHLANQKLNPVIWKKKKRWSCPEDAVRKNVTTGNKVLGQVYEAQAGRTVLAPPLFYPSFCLGRRALDPWLREAQGALMQSHGWRRGLRTGWTQAQRAVEVQKARGVRRAGGGERPGDPE